MDAPTARTVTVLLSALALPACGSGDAGRAPAACSSPAVDSAADYSSPLPACSAPTGVFFSDLQSATVLRYDLGTRSVTTVAAGTADDLALDSARGELYWPEDDHTVVRVKVDGSARVTAAGALPSVYGIALDLVGQRLVWTNQSGLPKLQRSSLCGEGIESLVPGDGCCTVGVALDLNDRRMYWMDGYYGGTVTRAALDGSSPQVIATTVGIADGIDVDAAGGKVYWTEYGNGPSDDVVRRANLDGTAMETLLDASDGLSTPQHIAVDPAGGYFYLADLQAGLLRARLDGTAVETLWHDPGEWRAVALDRAEPCR